MNRTEIIITSTPTDDSRYNIKQDNTTTTTNTSSDFLALFDNSDFEDIDLDYLDSAALAPFTSTTMSDETRRNLRRIQERTMELERERRGN